MSLGCCNDILEPGGGFSVRRALPSARRIERKVCCGICGPISARVMQREIKRKPIGACLLAQKPVFAFKG